MGVLSQTSFKLNIVGWGLTQPNGSKSSTPAVAAIVAAPWHRSSRLCVAASPRWTGCAGPVTHRCCWHGRSARPATE